MASNRIGRKTALGFADPRAPVALDDAAPAANGGSAASGRGQPDTSPNDRKSSATKTPIVEVEVTYERGSAPRAESMRRVYEIWTNNHVYSLDSRMQCIEVRATVGDARVTDHPFLGTRLVGGQIQTPKEVEMSYPFPRPGAFAVFESRRGAKRQFSRTSAVTRVVLRLRIVSVTENTAVPTWEEVSGDS